MLTARPPLLREKKQIGTAHSFHTTIMVMILIAISSEAGNFSRGERYFTAPARLWIRACGYCGLITGIAVTLEV
ncbi:hypothetical protein ACU21_06960 [Actinobaculum suis]|nr:hypothetical protein ACU19_02005 [Actinobaculum suis]OCA93288.1 hypothetical protein ACU20_01885 [Actinobaculum suis]OCA94442.1 hypothetical protein ACU21_06960 [Actinobaculum suis]